MRIPVRKQPPPIPDEDLLILGDDAASTPTQKRQRLLSFKTSATRPLSSLSRLLSSRTSSSRARPTETAESDTMLPPIREHSESTTVLHMPIPISPDQTFKQLLRADGSVPDVESQATVRDSRRSRPLPTPGDRRSTYSTPLPTAHIPYPPPVTYGHPYAHSYPDYSRSRSEQFNADHDTDTHHDYDYDPEKQGYAYERHYMNQRSPSPSPSPPTLPYVPATYQPPGPHSLSPSPEHAYTDTSTPDRSTDNMVPSSTNYSHRAARSQYGEGFEEARMEKLLAEYQTQHVGIPPTGPQKRRRRTHCKVELTEGNLVIELPVPSNLRVGLTKGVLDEMRSARYTAVTCDPDEFLTNRYSLRQSWTGRETELLIAITMYNEDEILLSRTLYGVMQGIGYLCGRKNSKTWGVDSWKKVVVCIVSDGRKNVNPRVLDCLAALGVYQDGVMKSKVKDEDVSAHVFEYTTTFALDPDLHFKYPDKGVVPTQIIFCLKEKNAKKINSHRWLFNAFGKVLQPNVCILLDVGTRPGVQSLYHIWKAFDVNSNVGGACGEIAAYKGPYWSALLNPLVAAQNFEYKMSNLLDKPWESICGYISVLPGAFSAYRYIALQNDRNGVGPLASYFKGEVLGGADTDIFTSNMYLAEDRILCFELVAKSNANWVLKYVKSAVGETDVPDSLPEFIMQRRRWLNGSLFAAVYALAHLPQMLRSGHGLFRKLVLVFEAIFNSINLVFMWFGLANYYLFFVILTSSVEDPIFGIPKIRYFNYFVHFGYAATLASIFIISLGNKPKAAQWKYKLATIFFSILTVYMIGCATVCTIRAAMNIDTALFVRMIVSIGATYGIYLAASILALDPWHMFTSFLPYLILSPMYLNILTIFAFCNLDDISWGTKTDGILDDLGTVTEINAPGEPGIVELDIVAEPADVDTAYLEALSNIKTRKPLPSRPEGDLSPAEKEQATKDYYASVRTNVLLCWILSNGILAVFVLGDNSAPETFSDGTQSSRTRVYMSFILIFVASTSAVRFLGSNLYLLTRLFAHFRLVSFFCS